MQLKLKFFASYREKIGREEENLDWAVGSGTLGELVLFLRARGGVWQEVFTDPHCLMAINTSMARTAEYLHEGDEVAFFPPVTGG